jgi:molecular chaperone GrpE
MVNKENQELKEEKDLKDKTAEAHAGRHNSKKEKSKPASDKVHLQEIEKLKSDLSAAGQKLLEAQDKYLRLSAEFDNYRKRTLKEKTDLLKAAGEDTIIRVLPVVDDFERAMTATQISTDIEAVKSGITLIYNKFKETLSQMGVKEIDALNKDFNTDLHEAITKIPAASEDQKGKVVDVVVKGYYLNDKILRFAKVVVGE